MTDYKSQPGDAIAIPTDGKPECLLTWIRRPGGGIRLYASRDLHSQHWGQRTVRDGGPVHWHLDTTADKVLIVDRDQPGEAIDWVLQYWSREDAREDNARIRRELRERAALDPAPEITHEDDKREYLRQLALEQHARAGMIINDPDGLTRGAGSGDP